MEKGQQKYTYIFEVRELTDIIFLLFFKVGYIFTWLKHLKKIQKRLSEKFASRPFPYPPSSHHPISKIDKHC